MGNIKNGEEFEVGKLLAFRDLTETQKDIFIKLVSNEYSYIFQVLFNIIDDDYLTLELIDVLIDGRYEQDKRDITLPLRGSSNQRIIYMEKNNANN